MDTMDGMDGMDTVVATGALTEAEKARLVALEKQIRDGMTGFVEVGLALAEIRDKQLWRGAYKSWEEYARKVHEMARSYAYRVTAAAQVVKYLEDGQLATLPANEAQVRPLLRVPEDAREAVWQAAVREAGDSPVTAKIVAEAVRKHLGDKLEERRRQVVDRAKKPDVPEVFKEHALAVISELQAHKKSNWKALDRKAARGMVELMLSYLVDD